MYQLLPSEIVVDNFAGGGGASTGIRLGLNRHVDIAINHDPEAIDMHKVNHPETKHYCESVWDVDPVEACAGRPVGLAWFSPDCKHFSKAKGDRPVDKKIRGLAWVAVKWALKVPVRVLMLENVEEFMTWGPVANINGKCRPCTERKGETFEAFVKALTTGLSPYHPAWKEMCDAIGIEDDVEAKRKLRHGLGYSLDYRLLKACDYGCGTSRERFFLVARNDGEDIQWPEPTHGEGKASYVTAADSVDWSIPVKSIFGRKRPLAPKTLERIAKGLEKFVINNDNPFFVPEQAQIPFVTECANSSNQRNMPIDEPLRTITAYPKGGSFALVTSHVIKLRNGNIGHGMDEPMHTISAGGNHLGEVRAFLISYYGTSGAQDITEPLNTITTKDRHGLVVVKINGEDYQIVDIGLRMFEPHELFKAQGFGDDYKISHNSEGKKLSKKNQVAKVGNSVPPLVAEALVRVNIGQCMIGEMAA
ncbi:DNA cytosine methyltransferase [Vibrio vulnificus]|uniref:DNA cytosine methyltransferase n=1 Tax=Vibrio vulnificus TaxID=672 RepID=UPI0019D413F4|nr:DNA cytosine methyltransferase [Vibrio vulnificus]MBN8085910.1 DNA cytosine methyltransferase [Vibrio vulnificus]MBN8128938.1 DNA cytosine methyltransferase [Vibrio vulnificus]HAS6258256.1 DNA cytosine methyltransferase [Vibrio vulnificus]HDY8076667.1 DNA cytosine methyltransferase [Vibrio vulnificus]